MGSSRHIRKQSKRLHKTLIYKRLANKDRMSQQFKNIRPMGELYQPTFNKILREKSGENWVSLFHRTEWNNTCVLVLMVGLLSEGTFGCLNKGRMDPFCCVYSLLTLYWKICNHTSLWGGSCLVHI